MPKVKIKSPSKLNKPRINIIKKGSTPKTRKEKVGKGKALA